MTKGPPPDKPRPPRPQVELPRPEPSEDPCAAAVNAVVSLKDGHEGQTAVAVPDGSVMLVLVEEREVGKIEGSDGVRLVDCSRRGWAYAGSVVSAAGGQATVRLIGRRLE